MSFKGLLVKCYFLIIHLLQRSFGTFITAKYFKTSSKKAYLVGTPEHDNLGDHAIALAEIQFIKRYFSDYEIVEISVEGWRKYKHNLLRKSKDNDIFFLTGGGNMGNIYRLDEELRRYIISHFPDNRVVIFPQTIYFTSDKDGQKELLKTKEIYNSHRKLLICAREKTSYSLMKEYFPNAQIYLCPDMVFCLEIDVEKEHSPKQAGVCLRDDCESKLSEEQRNSIINSIENNYAVNKFNTCLSHGICTIEREKYVRQILSEISQNGVVVTDRLHGVIFSVITGIPCIALSGVSHKIISTREWLSEQNALVFLDDITKIKQAILPDEIDKMTPFDTRKFGFYYDEMAKLIGELPI